MTSSDQNKKLILQKLFVASKILGEDPFLNDVDHFKAMWAMSKCSYCRKDGIHHGFFSFVGGCLYQKTLLTESDHSTHEIVGINHWCSIAEDK